MSDTRNTKWAIRPGGTLSRGVPASLPGADYLQKAELQKLGKYQRFARALRGLRLEASAVQIMNRETGEVGTFVFTGAGVGAGMGRASVSLPPNWVQFETGEALTLNDFKKIAIMADVSAGIGIGYSPISLIRFAGIDVKRDSLWENLWWGNGIDFGSGWSATDVTLGANYVVGTMNLIAIGHEQIPPDMVPREGPPDLGAPGQQPLAPPHDAGVSLDNPPAVPETPLGLSVPSDTADVAPNYSDPSGAQVHITLHPEQAPHDDGNTTPPNYSDPSGAQVHITLHPEQAPHDDGNTTPPNYSDPSGAQVYTDPGHSTH